MKIIRVTLLLFLSLVLAIASACSSRPPKAPDVTTNIGQTLDQAGLNDVSVSQDRNKSVVTLTGKVPTDNDKTQAESIARSIAGTQVVAMRLQSDRLAKKALLRRSSRTSTKLSTRTLKPNWWNSISIMTSLRRKECSGYVERRQSLLNRSEPRSRRWPPTCLT
jgi:hypothetical protein